MSAPPRELAGEPPPQAAAGSWQTSRSSGSRGSVPASEAEPRAEEADHRDDDGCEAMLDVLVSAPSLVAWEEGRQVAGGLGEIDSGDDQEDDSQDRQAGDERGPAGSGRRSAAHGIAFRLTENERASWRLR